MQQKIQDERDEEKRVRQARKGALSVPHRGLNILYRD
jgi:hypothetical protein